MGTTKHDPVKGYTAMVLIVAAVGLLGCARTPSSSASLGPRTERTGNTVRAPSTVSGEDLHGIPAAQIEDLLEGRVAGVRVIRLAGGGISLRIGGPGSIHGDNEPLYVLDGMPLQVTPGRGLYWLNPGDIQHIEILKDVSATALYGARGANGVVRITTRRGHRRRE